MADEPLTPNRADHCHCAEKNVTHGRDCPCALATPDWADLRAAIESLRHPSFSDDGGWWNAALDAVLAKIDATPDRADRADGECDMCGAPTDALGQYVNDPLVTHEWGTPDRADPASEKRDAWRAGWNAARESLPDRADLLPHDHEALGCEYPCDVVAGTLEPRR